MSVRPIAIAYLLFAAGLPFVATAPTSSACHNVYNGCEALCQSTSIQWHGGCSGNPQDEAVYQGLRVIAGVTKDGDHVGSDDGRAVMSFGAGNRGFETGDRGQAFFRVEWGYHKGPVNDTDLRITVWSTDGITNVTTGPQHVLMTNSSSTQYAHFDFVALAAGNGTLHYELEANKAAPFYGNLTLAVESEHGSLVPAFVIGAGVVGILGVVWATRKGSKSKGPSAHSV